MWFKKKLCFLLTVFCLVSLVGCQAKSTVSGDALYKEGTFQGVSKNGRNGDITVEVTLTSKEIVSITKIKHEETPGIAETPIERIPNQIVEHQSLNVDTISGATITSKALLEAIEDAISKAGGDIEALKSKSIQKQTKGEVVNLTQEIVIVGAGAAGISAAVTAAQMGAESVMVFEKMPAIGGNALVSGGYIENVTVDDSLRVKNNDGYKKIIEETLNTEPKSESEAKLIQTIKEEYDQYLKEGSDLVFDSAALMALEYGFDSTKPVDITIDFCEWLTEEGMEWTPAIGIIGYPWPRWTAPKEGHNGQGFFAFLTNQIKENNLNVEIKTDTPVTELVVEDGKVTGVVAISSDGTEYRVTATKGVILSTGGFSANGEMLVRYNTRWENLSPDIITTNKPGAAGDGINMALKIGAQVANMDDIMIHPLADATNGSIDTMVGMGSSGPFINKEGLRFVDETLSREDISNATFNQTDGMLYVISDSRNSGIIDGVTETGLLEEDLIKSKQLFRADTLEELSKQIGVSTETLVNTIENYNKAVYANDDAEFNRKSFPENADIIQGPFYASPQVPAAHITAGGLAIDTSYRVLDNNSSPIEGLYAAGEVTNGSLGLVAFAEGRDLIKVLYGNAN